MKPGTQQPKTTVRDTTPADQTTVKTLTAPAYAAGVIITVETTSARVTFDGSDPSAASAPSHVIAKDQLPLFLPIGAGTVLKWISTANAASVVQATWTT